MSFWSRARSLIFGERKTASSLELFRELYGGRAAKSGAVVNWKTALEVTTVLACARVIADGIAQVPLKLMRDSDDGKSKLPAREHPLYRVLYARPNPWQTSFEFRETIAIHVALCGNAYAFKNVVMGAVRELIPFEPQHVTVKRKSTGELSYVVRLPGADDGTGAPTADREKEFPADAIWHIKGPSWNSYAGLESVRLAREAIGLAMATEETHAQLHGNGVQTAGIYTVEGQLTEPQYKALRDWLDKYQAGGTNAGKPMIIDRGAKWVSQAMNGVDSQHLETRRYQVEEICRAMRVMPIMVGYSDKASTYASAEQMFLAHVVHTLAPWYERLEQSIAANLLTEKEVATGLYACFIEEGLLRGAMKDTKDVLLGYVNGGLMTPNEGRAKLDLNPMTNDPAADPNDQLRIPANIVGELPDSTDEKPPADKPAAEE